MKSLSQDHKDLGIVYTPDVLVKYICITSIHTYILEHLDHEAKPEIDSEKKELILDGLPSEVLKGILDLLDEITILDPAVGAGYFLQVSFTVLLNIHEALIQLGIQQKSLDQIRLEILTRNLYGVDISKKAVELCLENLISLIPEESSIIDKNNINLILKEHIKIGNSLIGNTFRKGDLDSINELLAFNWDEEFPNIVPRGGFAICVGNPPWNILKPFEKEFFSVYSSDLSKYKLDKQEAKKIIDKLKTHPSINEDWIKYESSIKRQSEFYRKHYHYQSGLIQVGKETRRVSGDINLYKLFLERVYFLLQVNGVCGIILPSGIHSDAGTKGLRQLIFEENNVKSLFSFENRKGIFPSIHKSFKFDLLIFQKNNKKTTVFQSGFMLRDPKFLRKRRNEILSISWEKIKRFSPSAWSIIEFKSKFDIQIVEKMYQFPILTEMISGFSKIDFARELDVTIDSHYFNNEKQGFPIFEGKMIEQFTHEYKIPRYWIDEPNLLLKFGVGYSEFKRSRIGFRAVAASTNRRTMIAALIPSSSCCSNSIIYVKNYNKLNRPQMTPDEILYLLGIFN
ncbi:MAG: Eco57I restriction-modification methylase domain-containing protein, partial [Candidatus Hodarchaeales archaeon]